MISVDLSTFSDLTFATISDLTNLNATVLYVVLSDRICKIATEYLFDAAHGVFSITDQTVLCGRSYSLK